MIDTLYAMGRAPVEGQPKGSAFLSFMPLALIFLVFYFLLIRPQKKQAARQREMINKLTKGTKIVTNGGIHGKITALKGKDIELEIASNVRITLSRNAISQVEGAEQVTSNELRGKWQAKNNE